MKAIKKDGKVIIFIDEMLGNGQQLVDKYSESGQFDVVEAIPCPYQDKCSGHKIAWVVPGFVEKEVRT